MNLVDLIGAGRVVAKLRVADKPSLIAELARRAGADLGLPQAAIAASLSAREALGSTGIGNGIAVPHARIEGLGEMAAFFLRLDRAIDFAAIDGRPVDLVFLLLSPADGHGAHLAALAAVSRRLRDAAIADAVRRADAGHLRATLTGEPPGSL